MAGELFPYLQIDPAAGDASLSPYLPIELLLGANHVSAKGLIDSGAPINVLPYDVGVRLGAAWERQTTPVGLTGNLASNRVGTKRFNAPQLGTD